MTEEKVCNRCKRQLPATTEYFWKDRTKKDGLHTICKECKKPKPTLKKIAQKGYKVCNRCKRELQATNEFFFKDKDKKDGFSTLCKECRGAKFTPIENIKDGYKRCIECKEELPATLEYFPQNRDGIKTKCRKCTNEYLKRYHAKNREENNKISREYYQKNKRRLNKKGKQWYEDNKEEVLEWSKQYYEENSSHIKKRVKKYRQENKEKIAYMMKVWYKNNPEKARIYSARRRTRKMKLPATLTIEQWEETKKYFNHKCAYCGMSEDEHQQIYNQVLHQDHFIPLLKGGAYTYNNIIPACASCNPSKGDRNFFEWYPEQEFYDREREKKILKHLKYYGENIKPLSIL